MLTQEDVAKVYDTILSIPGMNEKVKIDLKITREYALLLNRIIQRGLIHNDRESSDLLDRMPEEAFPELTSLAEECLKKAGLIEFSEKLKMLDGNYTNHLKRE
jgi:hypothetical protein